MKFLTLIFQAKDTFHYSSLPTFTASVPLPLSPASAKMLFKPSCHLLFKQAFSVIFCAKCKKGFPSIDERLYSY